MSDSDRLPDNDDNDKGRVVSLDDFRPSAIKRMLAEALRREAIRTLPSHKRTEAAKQIMGDDDDDDAASEENDKKVALNAESKGEAREIPVTKDDLSRTARDTLTDKRTAPKPEADGSKRPVVKRRPKNPKLRNQKKGK